MVPLGCHGELSLGFRCRFLNPIDGLDNSQSYKRDTDK